MLEVLAGIYIILGYIAAGRILFKNTAVIGFGVEGLIDGKFKLCICKFLAGIFIGWILIPIWLVKMIINR